MTILWSQQLLGGLLAARGRGIARLIEGVMAGDPVAIGIVSVIGVGIVGYVVYQSRKGNGDSD